MFGVASKLSTEIAAVVVAICLPAIANFAKTNGTRARLPTTMQPSNLNP